MRQALNNPDHHKLLKNSYVAKLVKRGQKRHLNYVRASSFVAGLICGVFGILLILMVC